MFLFDEQRTNSKAKAFLESGEELWYIKSVKTKHLGQIYPIRRISEESFADKTFMDYL